MWRRVRRRLFYGIVRVLVAQLQRSPREFARAELRFLSSFAWWARGGERRIALWQLERAFPAFSAHEREELGKASLRNLADAFLDTLRDDRGVWISEADGARLRALAEGDEPLVLLTAHLGAWELLGAWLASNLDEMAVVTANPHNRHVDQWLRARRRSKGLRSFDRRRQRWGAARWLKRGGSLALLADHRSAVSSILAPWFGSVAPSALGPARLCRWSGATAVAVGIRRDPAGHRVFLGAHLRWSDDDDELSFTTRCNRALEDLIRQAPSEWTWLHRRYDESPPAAARRLR